MNSHQLAKLLLDFPNLPVATHALNHTYISNVDQQSHGPLKIGILHSYGGDHLIIGDISKLNINPPNWFVTEMLHGNAPKEWD